MPDTPPLAITGIEIADARAAVAATLTWDNFNPSQSSYEYVTHGLTESTAGLEQKVLFRCRIHGHVCLGDGHVELKNAETK